MHQFLHHPEFGLTRDPESHHAFMHYLRDPAAERPRNFGRTNAATGDYPLKMVWIHWGHFKDYRKSLSARFQAGLSAAQLEDPSGSDSAGGPQTLAENAAIAARIAARPPAPGPQTSAPSADNAPPTALPDGKKTQTCEGQDLGYIALETMNGTYNKK